MLLLKFIVYFTSFTTADRVVLFCLLIFESQVVHLFCGRKYFKGQLFLCVSYCERKHAETYISVKNYVLSFDSVCIIY